MNQKGLVNIILVVVAVILVGVVGYFVFSKKSEPKNISVCDVRKVDFDNYKVDTTQFGKLNFLSSAYVQNDDLGNPEWKFIIANDAHTYTFGSDVIRVIDITKSHLTGSGEWDIVVGYVCSNNQLTKVFEQGSISKAFSCMLYRWCWHKSNPCLCHG